MKLLSQLEKRIECWFLIVISALFFVLRIPSLFEPYWYGDEGIYQTMGLALSRGALLYRDVWDNKPPLLYVLYGIFAGDQFSLRFLSIVVGLICVILFFFLAKKLFTTSTSVAVERKEKLAYIATALFAFLFATPLLEGNIANAENFMLLPILIAAGLIFANQKLLNTRSLVVAGIISSIAFLFKIVGIFDFAAFAVFLGLLHFKSIREIPILIVKIAPYIIGFIIPIALTSLYFLIAGAFPQFYQGAFTQMVGYVGYGNYFLIPQGLLIIKLILLGGFLLLLLSKRKIISPGILFILCWLAFSVFNTFFAQRPYIHYLLVLLPSFSLFTAYVYGVIYRKTTNAYEKKIRALSFILFAVILFLIFNTFNLYSKPFSYYTNFLSFITGQKETMEYYNFFDRNTPKDYQIVQFLKMNTTPEDTIFIWGNNAQVYKMSDKLPPGRFTVAYHMTANNNTIAESKKAVLKQNPKFIIITSLANPLPFPIAGYNHRINIQQTAIYERIN